MLKKSSINSITLHDKVLESAGIQEAYLSIIKTIYSKPIENAILNGEKHKAIPLKSVRKVFTLSISIEYSTSSSS